MNTAMFKNEHWHLTLTLVDEHILRMTYTAVKEKIQKPTVGVSHASAEHNTQFQPLDGNKITLGDFCISYQAKPMSVRVYYQNALISEDFEIDIDQVKMKTNRLKATGVYGLGEKYAWMNRIETKSSDWCTDVIGKAPLHHGLMSEYHTAMPFFQTILSDQVVGRYWDNTFKTTFDLDSSGEGTFELSAEGGQLDVYLMAGKSVQTVTRCYAQLTGKMPMPRMDFLGYQQCRWSYMTEEEVLQIAQNMRKHDIPCDVIYLDIDYMQDYKVFTHDKERFGNIQTMNGTLKAMGIKTVAIIDPGVKVEKGYSVYDEGLKKKFFVLDNHRKPYVGQVWPGDSVYPDFLREDVRNWWSEKHQVLLDLGIDGIWNDMNEPADSSTEDKTLPIDCIHIDDAGKKHSHGEIHNVYAHYEAMSTYGALKSMQKTRPFLLTRAAFSGTQRYSALWTGDNSSLWEHLEASIPMLVNLGLTGYAYVGGDVGGFLNDSNGELLTRWTQFGAFMPLFRNHASMGSKYQEPWCFGDVVLKNVRHSIQMRYKFMTYLYTHMWRASVEGDPVLRPLFYKDLNPRLMNIQDQCYFGQDVLLAPVYRPGAVERMVYLPEGNWYGYETECLYEGGKSFVVEAPLERMPIFIKEGAILPQDPVKSYIEGPSKSIELFLYGGTFGETELYFDDGLSFDYEKGDCVTVKIRFELKDHVVNIYQETVGNFAIPEFKIVLKGNLKGKFYTFTHL